MIYLRISAFNINILDDVGLITTQFESGNRGTKKTCIKNYDEVSISLCQDYKSYKDYGLYKVEMPLGYYSDCLIYPTCGIAGEKEMIIIEDEPGDFFVPSRINAELIWFRNGYIEYKFSRGSLIVIMP